jgi:hypothetical protein
MNNKTDEYEEQFNKEKDEGIKNLLKCSFEHAVKLHDFDTEKYFARAHPMPYRHVEMDLIEV